jgi:hypothetical protein
MPRKARAVAIHVPHHVTQRGNGRQDVFFCERDPKPGHQAKAAAGENQLSLVEP